MFCFFKLCPSSQEYFAFLILDIGKNEKETDFSVFCSKILPRYVPQYAANRSKVNNKNTEQVVNFVQGKQQVFHCFYFLIDFELIKSVWI